MFRRLFEKLKRRYVYRDAQTGEFVSETFAKRHPSTTIKERVK